jgi:class 3 adenylate cyclase/tetratricopeptide (TPR) repeat protein
MDPPRSLERRIVSVLFADLVGFTPLSEGLDPEDVATIQDAYFATVRDVMQRHGGQLEKFIGDAAMAVFGLPRSGDDDAERAIAAGLSLIGAVEGLSAQIGLEPGRLQVRVGVNTGEVVSAESGPDVGRVTGDTVNVAARLQAAAEPSQVLVGELTAFATAATVELEAGEALMLKGKSEPVRAAVAVRLLPRPERSRAMGSLRSPLIGRADELQQIVDSISVADAGLRWLIVAPPGVGKSRLLGAVADDFVAAGHAVWRAFVRPSGASPLEPVAQLLLDALHISGATANSELRAAIDTRLAAAGVGQPRRGTLVDETLALVRPAALEAATAAAAPSTERDERFAAWIEALAALESTASSRRTAWLLEDLHWAAPDLLAFLDAATAAGRVVIASARPALPERMPDWAAPDTERNRQRLDLEPLAPVDARALVAHLVGDALPDDLVDRIVERSDGNPLFIEELLRSWISVGVLAPEDGGWRLTSSPTDAPLPSTVQAIYASQLDDLPADTRRLLRRASVAGRRFVEQSLGALDAADRTALDELLTRALVAGPRPAMLGDTYAYRHALLRDAGYASLARLERADLHVRLARWLEEAAAERADLIAAEIAHHLDDALEALPALTQGLPGDVGRPELARLGASWLERAAAQSMATAAPLTAALQLRRALAIAPDDDGLILARRWHRLGEAVAFSGDMDEAVSAYHAAIAAYEQQLEGSETARDGYAHAISALGDVLIEQLRFDDAERLADGALARLGDADDLPTARLLYTRAWARIAYRSNVDVLADLERVVAIAEAAGDARLQLDAEFQLDGLRGELGLQTRQEMIDGSLRLADVAIAAGNPRRAGTALRAATGLSIEIDPTPAAGYLDRAEDLAVAHGLREEQAWVAYQRTERALITGDWDAAWRAGEAALANGEANAYHRPVIRTWTALSPIALAQGRVDALRRAKAWIDPKRSSFPDSPFARFMHTALDLRFAAAGLLEPFEPAPAVLDIWDESPGMASLHSASETIADAWIASGRLDLVDAAIERMRAWDGNDAWLTPYRTGSEALVRGRLALARGNLGRAAVEARASLAAFERIPAPWGIARAIRLLEASGEAATADLDRAASLEAVLGIAAPATS